MDFHETEIHFSVKKFQFEVLVLYLMSILIERKKEL